MKMLSLVTVCALQSRGGDVTVSSGYRQATKKVLTEDAGSTTATTSSNFSASRPKFRTFLQWSDVSVVWVEGDGDEPGFFEACVEIQAEKGHKDTVGPARSKAVQRKIRDQSGKSMDFVSLVFIWAWKCGQVVPGYQLQGARSKDQAQNRQDDSLSTS